MDLKLYKTQDDDNVINKNKTLLYTIPITLKNDTDIIQPTILLNDKTNDFMDCNYAYLYDFNRYYFITNIEFINVSMCKLTMECDVLETYKQDILNSDVEINRGIKENEYYNTNPKTKTTKDIDVFKSDVVIEETKNIVLSTIGG